MQYHFAILGDINTDLALYGGSAAGVNDSDDLNDSNMNGRAVDCGATKHIVGHINLNHPINRVNSIAFMRLEWGSRSKLHHNMHQCPTICIFKRRFAHWSVCGPVELWACGTTAGLCA
jgi:hypothetical protein